MRDQLQMEAGTTSDKYSVLGAGVAKDSDGFVTILVFVYEGAASRKVQDFEERLANGRSMLTGQPWTEYFPESEVWNEGRALIARLRTERPPDLGADGDGCGFPAVARIAEVQDVAGRTRDLPAIPLPAADGSPDERPHRFLNMLG